MDGEDGIPDPPAELFDLPDGIYSIAFDLDLNAIERPAPDGWGARKGTVYTQIARVLERAGFVCKQYRDFQNSHTRAIHTWTTMVTLKFKTNPPGQFETIIRAMKMYFIPLGAIFDVTDSVRLGGELSHRLRGPTPRELVLPVADILDHIPIQPLPDFKSPNTPSPQMPQEIQPIG